MKITDEIWEKFKGMNQKIRNYIFAITQNQMSEQSLTHFMQEWEKFRKKLPKKLKES